LVEGSRLIRKELQINPQIAQMNADAIALIGGLRFMQKASGKSEQSSASSVEICDICGSPAFF
jgi:hypothetical protein